MIRLLAKSNKKMYYSASGRIKFKKMFDSGKIFGRIVQIPSQPRLPTIRKRKMLEDSVICSATSMPVKRKTYESNKCHLIMPDSQTSQPVASLTRSYCLAEGINYCVDEIGHTNVNYDEQQVVNSSTINEANNSQTGTR